MTREDITGLVLAGGQGSRMGGLDKGLQDLRGQALARVCAQRLAPQVGAVAINANRHLEHYAAWSWPVWPDETTEAGASAGPLSGFLAGLRRCTTTYLCIVPCDSPFFPTDLVQRLVLGLERSGADMAIAQAQEDDGVLRSQPVFCLLRTELRSSLERFLQTGRRKIDAWTAGEKTVPVAFNQPGDDPQAFFNINTLDQLQRMQHKSTP